MRRFFGSIKSWAVAMMVASMLISPSLVSAEPGGRGGGGGGRSGGGGGARSSFGGGTRMSTGRSSGSARISSGARSGSSARMSAPRSSAPRISSNSGVRSQTQARVAPRVGSSTAARANTQLRSNSTSRSNASPRVATRPSINANSNSATRSFRATNPRPSVAARSPVSPNADGRIAAGANSRLSDQARRSMSPDTRARISGDANARTGLNARTGAGNLAARGGADARVRTPNFGGRFSVGTSNRIRVDGIASNGAMARMGLRDGDEILSVNGRAVASQNDFQSALRDGSRNWDRDGRNWDRDGRRDWDRDRIPFVVRRNGVYRTLYWTRLGLALAGIAPWGYGYGYPNYGYGYGPGYYGGYGYSYGPSSSYYADTAPAASGAWLGVTLDPSYNDAAVVTAVAPGSPAEQIGILPGDAIWSLNGDEINSHEELTGRIALMQPGDPVTLTFGRDTERTAQAILGDRAARY